MSDAVDLENSFLAERQMAYVTPAGGLEPRLDAQEES
jgi:hypothetical protein